MARRSYYSGDDDQGYGSAFGQGWNVGSSLAGAIVKAQQQRELDAVAKDLMTPRAGLVSAGVDPVTKKPNVIPAGVSTVGTAPPLFGNYAELKLRQALQQQDLENQYKQAQTAEALAKAYGTGGYTKTAKPEFTPYQRKQIEWHQREEERKQTEARQKQFETFQQKNALDTPKLAQSFDKIHGKDSAQKFYDAVTQDSGLRGNIVNGEFIPDENGEYYTHDATNARPIEAKPANIFGMGAQPKKYARADDLKGTLIKYAELQSYLAKAKEIEDAGGKLYPSEYPKELMGTAPRAQLVTPGTSNLPTPSTQAEFEALPSKTQFIDGDGQIKVKP
jgi:hypothetical protein